MTISSAMEEGNDKRAITDKDGGVVILTSGDWFSTSSAAGADQISHMQISARLCFFLGDLLARFSMILRW